MSGALRPGEAWPCFAPTANLPADPVWLEAMADAVLLPLPPPPRGQSVAVSPTEEMGDGEMAADGRMPQPNVDGCVVWNRLGFCAAFSALPHSPIATALV